MISYKHTFAALFSLAASGAFALEIQNPQVAHGCADFTIQPSMAEIRVSDKAIINYEKFNVGQGESVRFIQPHENARVLNRINSATPSEIHGKISSNGVMYFVNPSGIIFGPDAIVSSKGFCAVAGTFLDSDFLNGRNFFSNLVGNIIHQGRIESGFVHLVAKHIESSGIIVAPKGLVSFVSGDEVVMGDKDGNFFVKVSNKEIEDKSHFLGAQDLLGITISGEVEAAQVHIEGNTGSKVELSGTITASNDDRGGDVRIFGEKILLKGATIEASGEAKGGTVLVGGDYLGQDDYFHGSLTFMDKDSSIFANALENGDGGKVIVWSDKGTHVHGSISARGGKSGGGGGFIETSSRYGLEVGESAQVDTNAPQGNRGMWLLDPDAITIVDSGGTATLGDVTTDGNYTTSYTVNASVLYGQTATLYAKSAITNNANFQSTGTTNLTFLQGADNGVGNIIAFQINSPMSKASGTLNLTFQGNPAFSATAEVQIGTTGGSAITADSITFTNINNVIPAGSSGTVQLTATSGITIQADAPADIISFSDNGFTNTPLVFDGAVSLGQNIDISWSTHSGNSITFNSTVDGVSGFRPDVVLVSGGTTTYMGNLGSNFPLDTFQSNYQNLGVLNVFYGNVSTSGAGDNFIQIGTAQVKGNTTFTADGSNTNFYGTLDGDGVSTRSVTLTGASVFLLGDIGATNPITLTANAVGTYSPYAVYFPDNINVVADSGNALTVTGSAVLGNTTINSTGGNINFAGIIETGGNVVVTTPASATATFNKLGNAAALTTLDIAAGGGLTLLGDITSNGFVTLGSSSGTITVGNGTTVTSLNIYTNGSPVTFSDSASSFIDLQADLTIDSTRNSNPNGGNVSFAKSLESNGYSLTITAGAASSATFSRYIGGSSSLSNFTVSAATIALNANVTTTAQTSLTATTAITADLGASTLTITADPLQLDTPLFTTYGSPLFIALNVNYHQDITFNTTGNGNTAGADITFNQYIDSNTIGGYSLTVDAGTGGTASFVLGSGVNRYVKSFSVTANAVDTNIINSLGNITIGSISNAPNVTIIGSNTTLTTTDTGSITIYGPVTLSTNATLSSVADITVNSTVNSDGTPRALTLTAGSLNTVTLSGAVGGGAPLSSLTVNAANIIQSSFVTTTGNILYRKDASNNDASIAISGSIGTSGGSFTTYGNISSNPLNIDTTGSLSVIAGGDVTLTSNNPSVTPPTISGNNSFMAITAGQSTVTIDGPFSGYGAATIQADTIVLNSTTSSNNIALQSVNSSNVVIDAQSISLKNNVTALTDFISIKGPVTLTGGITLNSATSLTANSTINSDGTARALTLTAGSGQTITLGGTVGATNPLSGVTFSTGNSNTISMNGGVYTTGATALTFPYPITLAGNSTIDTTNNGANASGANITLGFVVDGASIGGQSLSVNSGGGDIIFNDSLGSGTSLSSLTATGATITQANSVVTSGDVLYQYNASTNAAITLGGNIRTATGSVTTRGNIVLATSVTIDTTGFGTLPAGADITLTGYTDLPSNHNINPTNSTYFLLLTAGEGAINVAGLAGDVTPFSLFEATAGSASFNLIHSTGDITLTAPNSLTLNGSLTSSAGAIDLTGPVTLSGGITLDAGTSITTSSTINSDGTARALTLTAGSGQTITFGGTVGATNPLSGVTFTTGNSNTISMNGGVYTTGATALTFPYPITLTGNSTIDTTNNGANTTGSVVTFSSTVNATTSGAQSLTINAGTGAAALNGAQVVLQSIGNSTSLSSVSITAGHFTNITDYAVIGIQGSAINTTGNITFTGPTLVDVATPTLTSSAGNISFSTDLDSTNTAYGLIATASSGTVTFTGAVGAVLDQMASLTVNAANISQVSTASVGSGGLTYQLDATTNATSITLGSGGSGGNITSSGAVVLKATNVYLGNSVTIDTSAGNGAITTTGTLESVNTTQRSLTLNSGSGAVSTNALGNATTALSTLTLQGTGAFAAGGAAYIDTVTISLTGGSATFNGATTINTNVDTSNGGAYDLGFAGGGSVTLTADPGNVFSNTGTLTIANDNGSATGANTTLTFPNGFNHTAGPTTFRATNDGATAKTSTIVSTTIVNVGALALSGAGTTILQMPNLDFVVEGALSGSGNLSRPEEGTIKLQAGAPAFTGTISSTSTTAVGLNLSNASAAGNFSFGGEMNISNLTVATGTFDVAFSGGGTVDANGGPVIFQTTGDLSVTGLGVTFANGFLTSGQDFTLSGPLVITNADSDVTVNNLIIGGPASLEIGSNSFTVNGTVSGAAGTSLTRTGAGETGAIFFNGGTSATFASDLTLQNTAGVTISNTGQAGDFVFGGNSIIPKLTSSVDAATNITFSGGGSIGGPTGGDITFSNTGNLIISNDQGTGTTGANVTLTFAGALTHTTGATLFNAYTGGTTTTLTTGGNVSLKSLNVGSTVDAGAGTCTLSMTSYDLTTAAVNGFLQGNGTLTRGSGDTGSITFNAGTSSFNGSVDLQNSGGVTISGGIYLFQDSATITSLTATSTATTVSFTSDKNLGTALFNNTGSVTLSGGTTNTISTSATFGSTVTNVSITSAASATNDYADLIFNNTGTVSVSSGTSSTNTIDSITTNGNVTTVSISPGTGSTTTITSATFGQSGALTLSGAEMTFTNGLSNSTQTNISTTVNTTNTAVSLGVVVLTNHATINTNNATGGNVTFSSTIDGGYNLVVTAGTGSISFGGAIGSSTKLASLSVTGSAISVANNISTADGAVTFTGPVTLTGASTIATNNTAAGGNVSFSSTVDGTHALVITTGNSSTTFSGALGSTTRLASLSVTSNAISVASNIRTDDGVISLTGPVTLTGASTMTSANATGANISFSSTINGGFALAANAGTGSVSFGDIVGGSTKLASLSATGSAISVANNISTDDGVISFTGPVTLTGASTMTSANATGGNISFSSTINGAFALVANAGTGSVSFGGIVGGSSKLASLSATGSGGISVANNISTADGAVDFTGPVTLTGASTIATNNTAAGGNVSFSSTVDGSYALIITTGNSSTTFSGALGSTTRLASLSVTSGAISVASNIRTDDGAISLTGPVTLTGASTMTSANATGANISFSSTINGGFALAANAGTGTVSFGGIVGGSTKLASLSATGSGGISVANNISTDDGAISFTGPVTLTGASTMTSANATGGNISFSSTINGAFALVANAGTGTISFGGIVGGSSKLASLSATGSDISIGNNISTADGAVDFTGPVTLTGASTIATDDTATGANVTFSSTIDGTYALVITTGTGNTTFSGALGSTTRLASLSVTSNAISVASNIRTDDGAISLTGPVTLTGASTMTSANATGGNISFSSTINGGFALAANAGTGTISFGGIVGGSSKLASLSATGSDISIGNNISTADGAVSFTGPVTLTGASTIATNNTAAGGNVSFSSTVDGSYALIITTGNSSTTFSGALGSTTRLASLSVTSGAISVGANIRTDDGAISLTGPVTLTGASTMTSANATGGDISFSSTINGAFALAVNAGTGTISFGGVVGGSSKLASLSATGSDISIGNNISTADGAVSFTGPVTLTGASTIATNNTAAGGNVSFSSTVDGGYALVITTGNSSTTFSGALGSTTRLASLSVTSNVISVASNIRTDDGVISLTGPVTLTGASTMTSANATGGNISFSSTINGAFDLTANAGTGTVSFGGIVGGSSKLASLSATGSDISVANNISTADGAVSFTGPVTLTGASTIATDDTATGANVTFSSTIDGTYALVITTGTGNTTFSGALGSTTRLASLSVTSNAISVSSNISADNGAISLTGPVTLTGNSNISSANTTGADIAITSVVQDSALNSWDLIVNAGASGAVTITSLGSSTSNRLDTFTVANSLSTTVSGAAYLNTLTLQDTVGTITFSGAVDVATSLGTVANGYNVTFSGGATISSGSSTSFINTGSLTLADNAVTFVNGFSHSSGTTVTSTTINTTNSNITLGALTLAGATTLAMGSGDLTVAGALTNSAAASLTRGSGDTGIITLQGGATLTNATLDLQNYNSGTTQGVILQGTSTYNFGDTTAIKHLSTAATAFTVNFTGGCTITEAATFSNTGTSGDPESVKLSSSGSSHTFTFTGGMTNSGGTTTIDADTGVTTTLTSGGGVDLQDLNYTGAGSSTISVGANFLNIQANTSGTGNLTLETTGDPGGTIGGNVSGSGALTIEMGAGSFSIVGTLGGSGSLSSSNSNTGTLQLEGGTSSLTSTLSLLNTGGVELSEAAGTNDYNFGGSTTISTLTTSTDTFKVTFSGGATITSSATFTNTKAGGNLEFNAASSDKTYTFTGSLTNNAGDTIISASAGRTSTVAIGADSTVGVLDFSGTSTSTYAVTLNNHTLTVNGNLKGTVGTFSSNNATTGTLALKGGTNAAFAVGLDLQHTGSVELSGSSDFFFGGITNINTLTTSQTVGQTAYDITFSGGGTVTQGDSSAGPVVFYNTGELTLASDITFTNGFIHTAGSTTLGDVGSPSTTKTITTTSTGIQLGDTTVVGNAALSLGSGNLSISGALASSSSTTLTVSGSGSSTFTGTTGSNFDGAMVFNNTGGVSLTPASTPATYTFAEGLTTASTTTTSANLSTSGTAMTLGAVTLQGSNAITFSTAGGTLTTGAVTGSSNSLSVNVGAAGNATLASLSINSFTVAQAHNITISGTTTVNSLTLSGPNEIDGTVLFTGYTTVNTAFSSGAGTYNITFTGGGYFVPDLNFQNTGDITFTGGTYEFLGDISFSGGGSFDTLELGGDINLNGSTTSINNLVVNEPTTVNVNATGGTFTINDSLNGSYPVVLNAPTGTITLNGSVGDTAPPSALTVNASLLKVGGQVMVNGGPTTINAPVQLTNNTTFTDNSNIQFSNSITCNDGTNNYSLSITSTDSYVTVGGSITTFLAGKAGKDVTITAAEDISVNGITTRGDTGLGGGNVTLTTVEQGDVVIAGINTSGGATALFLEAATEELLLESAEVGPLETTGGPDGGSVTINSVSSVVISGDINANGGDGTPGGNGGNVTISSSGGDVTTANIYSNGGASSGNGGTISVTSSAGSVLVRNIESKGSSNGGAIGGDGGNITLACSTAYEKTQYGYGPLAELKLYGSVINASGGTGTTDGSSGVISLSRSGRTDPMNIATIYGDPAGSNLTITGGSIYIGPNESFTQFGVLSLQAPDGTVAVGDINATSGIIINATDLILQRHVPNFIIDYEGFLTPNRGLHFASAGDISYTGTQTYTGQGINLLVEDLSGIYTPSQFAQKLVWDQSILNFDYTLRIVSGVVQFVSTYLYPIKLPGEMPYGKIALDTKEVDKLLFSKKNKK